MRGSVTGVLPQLVTVWPLLFIWQSQARVIKDEERVFTMHPNAGR